jgi:hypothetical protein
MRTLSRKSCRKHQSAHFMFCNFFRKIVMFVRKCGKIRWSQRGRRWQYGGALHAGLVRIHLHKHKPASVHTHTHTHTHTICNTATYFFSTATMVSRTRPLITLYVHCYCCSNFCPGFVATLVKPFKQKNIKSRLKLSFPEDGILDKKFRDA